MSSDDILNDSIVITSVGESSKRTRRDWIILLCTAVILAVALRFIRIGHREFYGGEFLTLEMLAGRGPSQFLEGALRGATSIYYMLLKPWAALVGTGSEGLLRLPSAIISLAAAIIFFMFSRRYLRGTARAICLLIFTMNPILIATANEATPFPLLTLFVVLGHFYVIRALDKGGLGNWVGYGLSALAGILSHPIYLFVLPAHFLFALLRGRRTPRAFIVVSIVGLIALGSLAVGAIAYAEAKFPDQLAVQRPSTSELVKSLVSVILGDFQRYEGNNSNDFVRSVMYIYVLICIMLSVLYYRKRTAEAMAMPDNVIWIDETQDVVGRWKRLSLRGFLLFQWFGFLVPMLGLFFLGGFVQGFHLTPQMLLITLPALAVLMAMGIDAAPREGALAMGVLLVLAMTYYDSRVLTDTGFGVKPALKIVREKKFDPEKDLLVFTEPNVIWRAMEIYRGDIPATPIKGFSNRREFEATQALIADMSQKYQRIFVIYHDDRRKLGRTEERSPLREWFRDTKRNGFDEVEEWRRLSPAENTQMHLYKHLAPGEQPED